MSKKLKRHGNGIGTVWKEEYVAKDKRKLREGGGWCDQSVYILLWCFQRTNEFKTLKPSEWNIRHTAYMDTSIH